jgi:hypothetical protein
MANIQIGKYKRPGIFIEEFDQSIMVQPIVEGGITNIVIGSSKKGPINTPIRLNSVSDLEAVFGPLDRQLERKGSFFHRTVSKMLEIAPVFAMNLLLTDDNLDRIEYRSLSTSSGLKNDIKRTDAYRKFYDTTGFWSRDTESFLNLTKSNSGYSERALNLTNMSDRPISVFVFKSTITGFDRTLIEWYGSADKLPTYLSAQDFASDYMVDVLVVGGDWSNYRELSVDPRWSAYFSTSGLKKSEVRNFVNDRNVSLLAFYEGLSLIPFFRDSNGRNVFIESVVNRDTDKTGLFCAFNNDLVEEDFYNGLLDLTGNTIVGRNETEIDFLSYKETISEKVEFKSTPLDLPGNVTALFGGVTASYLEQGIGFQTLDHAYEDPVLDGIVRNGNRTAYFAEGSVHDLILSFTWSASEIEVNFSTDSNPFAIMGGRYLPLSEKSFTIERDDYPSGVAQSRVAFVINNAGDIVSRISTDNQNPPVSADEIVLGYFEVDIDSDFVDVEYYPVTIDDEGLFADLVRGVDYVVTYQGNGVIKVEFLDTAGSILPTDYYKWRKVKMFNHLISILDTRLLGRVAMNLGVDGEKYSLKNSTVRNIQNSRPFNKSFELTGLPSEKLDAVLEGYLVFYTTDNEFIPGNQGIQTIYETADLGAIGVVAEFSTFYRRFVDGVINTRDFFYTNRLYVDADGEKNEIFPGSVGVEFIKGIDAPGVDEADTNADFNYIKFHTDENFQSEVNLRIGEKIIIPNSTLNIGEIEIISGELALELGITNSYVYQVSNNITRESLTTSRIDNADDKVYLKMYLDAHVLNVHYRDSIDLDENSEINAEVNWEIFVNSRKSNLKQTIEIEVPNGYVEAPNKILINAQRYTEVKVGDFLEAEVDPNVEIADGQVNRKLTRILSKRLFAGNPEFAEVTCDSSIKKYDFSGDKQTMRYVSIDNYASSYKAIALKGFKLRLDSLPDGTEERQNQILNIVAKGTPLFKSLVNKEAIDFRYLIDSFGLGLTEKSKQQLVDICGARLDSFGFINMPSIKQFKNSTSPTFLDENGDLMVEFIAKGGNPESNPAFLYSFGDGAGSTSVGYFTPYVKVNDNGRELDMPPASYVATTYMRKHVSNISSVTPWTIAAGVTNGRVSNITGIEIDFNLEDIEFLNEAQMNPIVFKKNRGFVIETQNTAQTLFRSALSFINVREVLIELERELSAMLLDYQWKFNTPDVRSEIKLRADVICETYVNRNGLFNYFNKMDDENNTPDLIDNQIGVLDTYVEPIKGMGIIVNNITILRTGAISAGGFINP